MTFTKAQARATAVLAATGALLMAAFLVAPQAQASTLYACYKKKTGSARIVTSKTKCKKGESKVSWSSVGPAGKTGATGAAGATGLTGKEGVAGQPQSAVAFNQNVEAELLTEKFASLFSLAGVSVRLDCSNAFLANVASLEASGPAGTLAVSGMVDERANLKGEATESVQQLVYDVGVATNTKVAGVVTNGKGEVDNVGHIDATITTPSAVIIVDAYIKVGSHCIASGTAFSIPT